MNGAGGIHNGPGPRDLHGCGSTEWSFGVFPFQGSVACCAGAPPAALGTDVVGYG